MTLVIATGGIDLSVGAVVAISGAVAVPQIVSGPDDQNSVSGVLVGGRRSRWPSRSCSGCGTASWSPASGIQPIIATLILMVAGRGVAQLITDGQIITVDSPPYKLLGGGLLARRCRSRAHRRGVIVLRRRCDPAHRAGHAHRVGRRQRRGQPAGRHPVAAVHRGWCTSSSRLCAGVAGLMVTSNVVGRRRQQRRPAGSSSTRSSPSSSAARRWPAGGSRSAGTVVGALVIQTLTTTVYTIGHPAGDHAAVQGARRHRRLPDPVAAVPRAARVPPATRPTTRRPRHGPEADQRRGAAYDHRPRRPVTSGPGLRGCARRALHAGAGHARAAAGHVRRSGSARYTGFFSAPGRAQRVHRQRVPARASRSA